MRGITTTKNQAGDVRYVEVSVEIMVSGEENKGGALINILVSVVGILREGVAGLLMILRAVSMRGTDYQYSITCSSSEVK